ncbi:Fibronectin [Macleaya cordata]|uniref:Fibronectin n=1 Tax=Macleaya cordata TaxID=56857 RepID=A0A200R8G8_MACCD|nr:Fibronectin [Macleaya cordata]
MLSMDEKRELVYEISKWSQGAPEMLQSWSRRELLEILCAEMGKERKYTGLTKIKMIEHLLKIVSEKKSVKRVNDTDHDSQPSPANNQNTSKRQRKTDNPSRLPIVTNNFSINDSNGDQVNTKYCQNSACRATLRQEDTFCKRCSCCICYQYDDNKDPSLWLVCSSEPPYQDDSCGMSCHLECALKHERAGIVKDGQHEKLDGGFYCVSCGKLNDLLGCWRKQLMTAKDTRRVDTLCYRVSLSQKLLHETEKYQKLHEIVCTAAKKLEAEVGPLAGLPVKMARGIVNRLSSGPEVQKLCASAVESLDSMLSCCSLSSSLHMIQECSLASSALIRFENVSSTSLTVVLGSKGTSSEELVEYTLWHRRADVIDYPADPTCMLFTPNTRFLVSDLSPATEYLFKAVAFCDTRELGRSEVRVFTKSVGTVAKSLVEERGQSPTTNSSILSNPSSEVDESNNSTLYRDQTNNPTGNYFGYCMKTEINDSGKNSDIVSKDISDSQNTSTGTEKEGTPGDSACVLDEERITGEVVSVPNSEIKIESQSKTNCNQGSDVLIPEKHPPELVERINGNGSNSPVRKQMELVPFEGGGSDAVLPITPCKLEIGKEGPGGRNGRPKPINEELENRSGKGEETQAGSSSKKRSGARWDQESPRDGSLEGDYEYCVKVIRWLECEGHIEKNFRVKFLTWYSLRATPQERKVVKVFVDTFMDDPAGLAGQLIDTFLEGISSKRPPVVPPGFCMKLWH